MHNKCRAFDSDKAHSFYRLFFTDFKVSSRSSFPSVSVVLSRKGERIKKKVEYP